MFKLFTALIDAIMKVIGMTTKVVDIADDWVSLAKQESDAAIIEAKLESDDRINKLKAKYQAE